MSFTLASPCLRPRTPGAAVHARLTLRLSDPQLPVRVQIDRGVGTRGLLLCPTTRLRRPFTGRFAPVRTVTVSAAPGGTAVTQRQVTLALRLRPGLYRLTARARTPGGQVSPARVRFLRVLQP